MKSKKDELAGLAEKIFRLNIKIRELEKERDQLINEFYGVSE
jgi:hypothetical protein